MTDDPLRHLAAAGLQITAVHGREDTFGIPPSVIAAMEQEKRLRMVPIDSYGFGPGGRRAPTTFCGVCGTSFGGGHCPTCFPPK